MPTPRILLAVLAFAAGLAPFARDGRSDTIDPGRPATLFVGPPRGFAPSFRIDPARTGRTTRPLPTRPTELWRKSVGPMDTVPAVGPDGEIIAALSSGEIVRVDASGKERSRTRIPGGTAIAPPLLLASGTTVVMTSNGQITGISEKGSVLFTRASSFRGADVGWPLVGTADGGFVATGARTLATFFQDGTLRDETILPARAAAPLVVVPGGILALLDDGGVYRVSPPLAPRRLGTFGAAVESGFTLANARTAIGASRDQILALDLKTGISSVRFTVPSGGLVEGPITQTPDLLFATSTDGVLFAIDKSGFDVARATVERVAAPPPPAVTLTGGLPTAVVAPPFTGRMSPPLIADADGTVAFFRATGRLGVVTIEGAPAGDAKAPSSQARTSIIAESVCQNPFAVLPAGDRRMLAVCREGILILFGDAG